jgi:glutathione peroxidase
MTVYQYDVKQIDGENLPINHFEGEVLLIVNTASKCGFTPQYKELQQLYKTYHEQGFEVLAFPSNQFLNQEPGSEEEIKQFCELNFGVTFPIFSKIDVKGPNAHPLFTYLTKNAPGILGTSIKWNFTKFLVNRSGHVVKRYPPNLSPKFISKDIERLL